MCMTADELRADLRLRFTAISKREWCKVMQVNANHISEFVNGKRETPPKDLLRALKLEVRYVRSRRDTTVSQST